MAIVNHVHDLVKDTPLLYLPSVSAHEGVKVYAKLELNNPAGGIKDRFGVYVAKAMIANGEVNQSMTLIEATAGNTGLGAALGFIDLGISMIFVIPDKFSIEKQILLKAMGATVIVTPHDEGMDGALKYAQELRDKTPNSFSLSQFDSLYNPQAHYETTGPEIYKDLEGTIDYFIMGAGSGGTFTGISRYLKEQDASIQTIIADPVGSQLDGGDAQLYKIEGIGNHHPPKTLDMSLADAIIKVSDDEAMDYVQHLARYYGIFAGSSTGANLAAAHALSKEIENGIIVTILPDRAERYFSKHILEEQLWKK